MSDQSFGASARDAWEVMEDEDRHARYCADLAAELRRMSQKIRLERRAAGDDINDRIRQEMAAASMHLDHAADWLADLARSR